MATSYPAEHDEVGGSPTRIFVSYVKEDREVAERLREELENTDLNLKVWIDTQIRPGQVWEKEIKKGIKACRYFIALVSTTAVQKKGYPKKEFEYALSIIKETQQLQKIIVIPARLNDCKIPYSQLEKIQYVDLFPDWNEGFERLLEAIALGDNLVGGKQFGGAKKRRPFNAITRPFNMIAWPFNRSGTLDKPALSPSMLLLLDSSMEIDNRSIRNPRYDSYHTPSFFCASVAIINPQVLAMDNSIIQPGLR